MDKEDTMAEKTTGGQVKTEAPEQGQVEATPSQTPTQETLTADKFLETTGFKSYEEAAKSLKEGHTKITKLSQEKSQLEQALQAQAAQPAPVVQGQAGDFFDDPEGSTARVAKNVVQSEIRNLQVQQTIERVRGENPEKFEQLRPLMQQVFAEKPYLNNLGESGLRQAMQIAEESRVSYISSLREEIEAMKSRATTQTGTQATEAEIREELLRIWQLLKTLLSQRQQQEGQ